MLARVPDCGQIHKLDAIAAAILGRTPLLGGVGAISCALIRALILASLTTGLQMLNVQPAWHFVVKAIILFGALYVDVHLQRHR